MGQRDKLCSWPPVFTVFQFAQSSPLNAPPAHLPLPPLFPHTVSSYPRRSCLAWCKLLTGMASMLLTMSPQWIGGSAFQAGLSGCL